LTSTLKKYADSSGLLDKLKFEIAGDDFREGLTAIISFKVGEPQFEGQTKTKLGNREVTSAVSQAVSEMLENYLEENPNDAKTIVQKVILAAQARHAAQKAREMVQRKTVMSIGGLPGKLSDCSEQDPAKCEVFLEREIRQAEQLSKDVTALSKQFYPCEGKSSMLKKPCNTRFLKMKR